MRLLLAILLFPLTLFGQTFTNSTEPYTAKNGKVYHIGDSIVITTPCDFSNTFQYFVQGKNLETKKTAKGELVIGSSITPYDLRYTRYAIKQFKVYNEYGTYAVFDKLFNVMVNIERGVESGEIMSDKLREVIYNRPIALTDSVAYLAFLKREKTVSNDNAKEFLFLFDKKRYNEIREDEFLFHAEIKKTKSWLEKVINEIDLNQKYYLKFTDLIGNYDFDSLAFPLLWNNNGTQILDDTWAFFTPEDINKSGVTLTDLKIEFKNTASYNNLPLGIERGKYLVDHRKMGNGTVDRNIYLGIQFTINELTAIKDSNIMQKKDRKFICNIYRLDFFEDKDYYNYLNTKE